jgi:hypothetical protein
MNLGVVEWVGAIEMWIPIDLIGWEVRVADNVMSSEQEEAKGVEEVQMSSRHCHCCCRSSSDLDLCSSMILRVVEVVASIPIDSIDWEVRVVDDVMSSKEEGVRRFGVVAAAVALGQMSY